MSFKKSGKAPIIGVLDKKCSVCGVVGGCAHTSASPPRGAAAPPVPPPADRPSGK